MKGVNHTIKTYTVRGRKRGSKETVISSQSKGNTDATVEVAHSADHTAVSPHRLQRPEIRKEQNACRKLGINVSLSSKRSRRTCLLVNQHPVKMMER